MLNFTPRHSCRISKADRGLDYEAKAKHVLLLCLGILRKDEPILEAALGCYHKLFERPLASDVVQAFVDFYGWQVPANVSDLLASGTLQD